MLNISDFNIQLYADGANKADMLELYASPHISGFTTNPTLLKKAQITDYTAFSKDILTHITDRPISFEVFADDFPSMKVQAEKIKSWADNVFVKIPVMNTKKEYSYELIETLSNDNVKLNITAIMTLDQVKKTATAMRNAHGGIISVFAGRIADTGVDPVPLMKEALGIIKTINPSLQLLWASPRELLNIIQANEIGCDIITATPDILKKLDLLNKDLEIFSLETVQMFYNDAANAGFSI